MEPRTDWRWLRLLAGVVLPLLAGFLAAPTTARGSCGDYVHLAGAHADSAEQRHPTPDHRGAERQAPGQPRPCSGPHCSRHLPPSPAPAAVAPVPVEERCCPPATVVPTPHRGVAGIVETFSGKPSHLPAPVYHPPRLSPV
jgi:hypothetical protein